MKVWLKILGVFVVVLSIAISPCLANDEESLGIEADVPHVSNLDVKISRVVGSSFSDAGSINFNDLTWNNEFNIFLAGSYFAVDVGIDDNAATWTVTHSTTSLVGTTGNLDDHVNVTFVRQTSPTTDEPLSKVSYADSNGQSFTRSQIYPAAWLRIYYGIATGEEGQDAPGTTPISADNVIYGTYTGTITLSLTSN